MNCRECLSIVELASVTEVEQNRLVQEHRAQCEDCQRVVRLIAESERGARNVMDGLVSTVSATRTAEIAVAIVKRRRIARVIYVLCSALLVMTLWSAWTKALVPRLKESGRLAGGALHTESVRLRCLSPKQAELLILPHLQASGSAIFPAASPMQVITVRATPQELRAVKSVLVRFDNPGEASCVAPGQDRPAK